MYSEILTNFSLHNHLCIIFHAHNRFEPRIEKQFALKKLIKKIRAAAWKLKKYLRQYYNKINNYEITSMQLINRNTPYNVCGHAQPLGSAANILFHTLIIQFYFYALSVWKFKEFSRKKIISLCHIQKIDTLMNDKIESSSYVLLMRKKSKIIVSD